VDATCNLTSTVSLAFDGLYSIFFRLPILINLDNHMGEIFHGLSTAFVLKLLAAGLAFAFNVVLARLLGAEDTGLYFLALTCISIAAVIGRAGLDNTLIRFIAANAAVEDWQLVKGVYNNGLKLAFVTSCVTSIFLILAAPWLSKAVFSKPELSGLIRWMAIAVVPFALFTLHAQALQGLKRIRDAISVLSVFLPFFSLLGITVLAPYWGVHGAVWAYILASYITLYIGLWRWRKATPQLRGLDGYFETKQMLRSSVPLFWMMVLNLIIYWSSSIMLGIWSSSAEVGIFNIAKRTAMLTSFILIAVNSIVAPKFSDFYNRGDIKALEQTAIYSSKFMTLMATPVLLLFILCPSWVMSLFGAQFSNGAIVLTILAVGQFVNVATGSVGYLLIMSGHETTMRNIAMICAIICLILNAILIPQIGLLGAAVATAITLSLQNLIAAWLVWYKLGIITAPIGLTKTMHKS